VLKSCVKTEKPPKQFYIRQKKRRKNNCVKARTTVQGRAGGASCGVSQLLDTSFVPGCELVKVVVVVVAVVVVG
jgi:hypothetical protein